MRKKLMLLSALTCSAGGTALLGPAEAQSEYPPCEGLVNTQCYSNSPHFQYCTRPGGSLDVVRCYEGWWVWA